MGFFGKISTREEFTVKAEIQAIDIQGFNGSVTWVPVDADGPRIVAEKEVRGVTGRGLDEVMADLKIEDFSTPEKLVLRATAPETFSKMVGSQVTFMIYASPQQIKSFQARTSNGAISVEVDFEGRLELQTSNGRIEIQSASGTVHASTSNGRIEFGKLALSSSSSIRTLNGRIAGQAVFPEEGEFRFETHNGSIELRIPYETSGSFDARTNNGTVEYRVGEDQRLDRRQVLVQRDAGPTVWASTSNGRISILGY